MSDVARVCNKQRQRPVVIGQPQRCIEIQIGRYSKDRLRCPSSLGLRQSACQVVSGGQGHTSIA